MIIIYIILYDFTTYICIRQQYVAFYLFLIFLESYVFFFPPNTLIGNVFVWRGKDVKNEISESAVFSVLGSLGVGGVVRNLDVAAIMMGSGCLGTGLGSFKTSGRLARWLGRDSILQERV